MISGVEKRKWPRDGWWTLPVFSLTLPTPWMGMAGSSEKDRRPVHEDCRGDGFLSEKRLSVH